MGLVLCCARPMVVHNKITEKELGAVEGTQYVTKEAILRRAQEIKGKSHLLSLATKRTPH